MKLIAQFWLVVLFFSTQLLGCQTVRPWEKATLAKPTMRASGPLPEIGAVDQHVYSAKEAVKGGTGIGGGGCGCN